MEDVTDAAFRSLIAEHGRPDVTFCEFTSADGLALADEKGQKKLRRKLLFGENERPVVAQFFTAIPEHMAFATKLAAEMGFDGVDINMGCPANEVVRQKCGAGMIQEPALAREIIRAAKRGAPELPISVKTRLGYNVDQLEEWLPELLAEEPAAITIHARTRKEMSLVPARWERVGRAVEIRDALGPKTLILGNGDLTDVADAREKCAQTDADGALLGRAIYGNPWLFSGRTDEPSPQERIATLAEHIKRFEKMIGDTQHFAVMKKHFKAYISGWDGAKELRIRLMETERAEDALAILSS